MHYTILMVFQNFFIGTQAGSFEEATALLPIPANAQCIQMEQVHEAKITEINTTSNNSKLMSAPISKVDACFTTQKNMYLSVKSADCLPILIWGYSSENTPFIAAAHAGRKGTEKKILLKLLEKLNEKYAFVDLLQKKSAQIHIWFGPAICEKCYQIDRKTDSHYGLIDENKKQVLDFFSNQNLHFQKNPLLAKQMQLKIENRCTLHEPEQFYSYRATGSGVKMNYSFIGIS